jgi:uncharacterized repeat protein (TIGR01451 family)
MFSNTADSFGGGAYIYSSSGTLDVSGGGINNNSSKDDGGGIRVYQGSVTLNGTQVLGNSSGDDGGGVYVYQGSATLTETQVFSNTAVGDGGGVYVYAGAGRLDVSGGEINNNVAGGQGGGVGVYQGSATLSGTLVFSNTAGGGLVNGYGGGVYINQGKVTLTETHVVSNAVYGNFVLGGGVCVYADEATLDVSGGEISRNTTFGFQSSGGGICAWYGSATLNATQVVNNSVSGIGLGGGLGVGEEGSATLNGSQVYSNTASLAGGGAAIAGSMTLSGTQIAANEAQIGSALYNAGAVTPTTALTIAGDIAQVAGVFAGGSHDLRIEGKLQLAGGDFYAPAVPANTFALTGPFTHTAGTYHQTQVVNGSDDVEFPKAGGVILNANGQDLGDTEVALTAGATCDGITAGEAISHCYTMTPTNDTGRDAIVTFFYLADELPAGHACTRTQAYRWTGAWGTPWMLDTGYGADGRLCGTDPRSLRVTGVTDFGDFALRDPLPVLLNITKSVSPTTDVAYRGTVTYTVSLENLGSAEDPQVLFTDSLPTQVAFGAWIISPTNTLLANGAITWTGYVTQDHTLTWKWTATHTGDYGDIVTNTAEFSGTVQVGASEAVFTVSDPADITVAPLSLDFGDQAVDAGPTLSKTVSITNDGGADLHISAVTATGDSGAFNLADSGESTLTPGGTRTIEVAFDPATTGAKAVTLTIQSDDPDEPGVAVNLSGVGTSAAGPEITVVPSSLAFGAQDVDAGPTPSQVVTITNDGSADLHVASISLGGGDAAHFEIESGGSPGVLTPGNTRAVQVSFDPSTTGAKSANLTIQSDDGDEPSVAVALSGTGTALANSPPVMLSHIGNQVTAMSTPLSVTFTISDSDDPLDGLWVYAASSNLTLVNGGLAGTVMTGGGMSVACAGGQCALWITPTVGITGTTAITVTVDDSRATDSDAFVLAVGDVNAPPEFTSTPPLTGTVGVLYTYDVTASDPNVGDVLAITASTRPTWLTLTDNGDGTATLSGTPVMTGTFDVALEVSDGQDTDTQSFTITVEAAPVSDYDIFLPLVLRES